jgi:transposase
MSARRLAYTTDLADEEWQFLEPLLPPEKAGGRPRKYPIREVMHGIQYVLLCAARRLCVAPDAARSAALADGVSDLARLAPGWHLAPHP